MGETIVVAVAVLTPWLAFAVSAVVARTASVPSVAGIAAGIVGAGAGVTAMLGMGGILGMDALSIAVGSSSVRLDALAIILSTLVLGLSAVIQSFAMRYLRGDTRQGWFVATVNLLTAFTVLMTCAGSVAVFAIAWVGAGVALTLLLATYPSLAQARDGIRRTAIRFAIGDAAFLVGVVVLMVSVGGDVPFDRLGSVVSTLPLPVQIAVAVALVLGALARSSQLPFHGWLPYTLAAPTPVSALMHAGVVNAGAIAIIRFAPVIAAHQAVMVAIFLAGAATLVYATSVRVVRADVKGRLVFSTASQMGFMIMTCGLGLFSAAIFHLVAHSLFKSTLFLGAGMGVREHAVARDLPARRPARAGTVAAAVALAVLVPVGTLIAAKQLFAPTATPATVGLLAFVAVAASVALGTALVANFSRRTVGPGIGATIAAMFGYVAFLQLFAAVLAPNATTGAPAWLLVLPAIGLVGLEVLSRNPRAVPGLRDLVFARSLTSTTARAVAS